MPRDQSPYQLHLALDLGLNLIAIPGWLLTSTIIGDQPTTPHCGMTDAPPCDQGKLASFDRYFLPGHPDKSLRAFSDIAFTYAPPAYLLLSFLDYRIKGWKSWLVDSTVIIEAWAWSGFVNQIFRAALHRPRPYLYLDGVYPGERNTSEASTGYYSGHASEIFAFCVAAAYTFTLRHGNSPWTYVVWTVLGGLAVSTSLSRIATGDHFFSDVLVASLAGTGFGLVLPAIHLKRKPSEPGAVSWRLIPASGPGYAGLGVGGVF